MKIISGKTGTPHVTAQEFRQFIEGTLGQESYILTSGENLDPELSSNNALKIRSGIMSHHGNISCVELGTYDEVTIQNGTQNMKRIDLVVNRYSKNAETGIEKNEWIVIQGTPAAEDPVAPAYTEGNLQEGDLVDDCPAIEVHLDGINVTKVKQMLPVMHNMSQMQRVDFDQSMFAIESFWTVMEFNAYKIGKTVYFNGEFLYKGKPENLQPDEFYSLNKASNNAIIRPKNISHLSMCATDASYKNSVPGFAAITTEGLIKYSMPGKTQPYMFISGTYETN
ncbi:MAG: hypothetical protein U0M78_11005 [Sellimonas sp.]|nr:hypothetical protein [Sellimonas sp.]